MSINATAYCVYGNCITESSLKSCFNYNLIAEKFFDGTDPDDLCMYEILEYFGLDYYFMDDEGAFVDDCNWYFGTFVHIGTKLEHINKGIEKVNSIFLSMDNTDSGFDYDKFCELVEATDNQFWTFTHWS